MNLPFGNSKKVIIILIIMICAFLIPFFIKSCRASDLDMMVGSTVVRGETSVIGLNWVDPRAIGNFADIELGAYLIGQSNWNGQINKNQAAVHAQVVSHFKKLLIGIGVGHLQHSDAYNSGSIEFSLSLQYPIYKQWYVRYQHFSNSGTDHPNYGRDMVLLTYRFK